MDRKASEEQLASALTGTEFWAGVQANDDVRITASQLLGYVIGAGKIVAGHNPCSKLSVLYHLRDTLSEMICKNSY